MDGAYEERRVLGKAALLNEFEARMKGLGAAVRSEGDALSAEIESIRARWFLGGRKATYRMSCRLDEAHHCVAFREAVVERSWGLPPPTFSVETTSVKGWKRSGARSEVSVGGGGSLDFAQVREALEQASANAGWSFRLEGGRSP